MAISRPNKPIKELRFEATTKRHAVVPSCGMTSYWHQKNAFFGKEIFKQEVPEVLTLVRCMVVLRDYFDPRWGTKCFIPPSPPPARSAAPHRNSVVLTRAKRSAKGGNKRALEGEFPKSCFLSPEFACFAWLWNGSLLESMLLCWDICWYSFLWSLSSSSMLWTLQRQVPLGPGLQRRHCDVAATCHEAARGTAQ